MASGREDGFYIPHSWEDEDVERTALIHRASEEAEEAERHERQLDAMWTTQMEEGERRRRVQERIDAEEQVRRERRESLVLVKRMEEEERGRRLGEKEEEEVGERITRAREYCEVVVAEERERQERMRELDEHPERMIQRMRRDSAIQEEVVREAQTRCAQRPEETEYHPHREIHIV